MGRDGDEKKPHQDNAGTPIGAGASQVGRSATDLERDQTIEMAIDLLGLKDPSAPLRARHITAFSLALARALSVPLDEMRTIARGAFLHDVGMIGVPDAILRKSQPFTEEEARIMQQHCLHGNEIVKKLPFLADAAEIVYAHEEHYDGRGYPRGLKGDEIPQGARIVAIASELEAVLNARTPNQPQSLAVARQKITEFSGQRFDPNMVRVFLNMPDKIWEDIHRQVSARSVASAPGMSAN